MKTCAWQVESQSVTPTTPLALYRQHFNKLHRIRIPIFVECLQYKLNGKMHSDCGYQRKQNKNVSSMTSLRERKNKTITQKLQKEICTISFSFGFLFS